MICEVKTAAEVIDKLGGPAEISKRLRGASPKSISAWKKRGIPPYWFDAFQELMNDKGISVSPAVFGMRKIRGETEKS